MNTLVEKLVENGKKAEEEGVAIVNEVKLLLDNNSKEERETLRSIGLDVDIRFVEGKNEDLQIRKRAKDKFGCQVLEYKEVRKFCLEYRMYLRPAREYRGTIPPELGTELTRFCKEKSIPLPASNSHSEFYIIAPPKMFSGYKTGAQLLEQAFNASVREIEQERLARSADPILIYRLQDKNYFAVIKSWGEDFTPLRRFYGWIMQPKSLSLLFVLFNLATVALWAKLNLAVAFFFDGLRTADPQNSHSEWHILTAVFVIINTILFCAWLFSDEGVSTRRKLRHSLTEKYPSDIQPSR